jgi:hypothetical protein
LILGFVVVVDVVIVVFVVVGIVVVGLGRVIKRER